MTLDPSVRFDPKRWNTPSKHKKRIEAEGIDASQCSVDWDLRHRHNNGLQESGAVIESPIRIHWDLYWAWKLSPRRSAAA